MADLRQAAGQLRTQLHPTDQPRSAPEENGERLATISRSEGEELRLNWSEFNGHHFLNLRIWAQGDDGAWWPQKDKGLTVRIRELADFAEGVAVALDRAGGKSPPDTYQDHQAPLPLREGASPTRDTRPRKTESAGKPPAPAVDPDLDDDLPF